jgi:hypothetical protein
MSLVSWKQVGWEQVGWKEVVWRDSNETGGYPGALSLLWPSKLTDAGVLKSAKGPAPTFTDTPTVTADGVAPGDGPAFTSVVTWTAGGTRMVRFTASSASADLVGDVEIGGGFYAASGGLEFRDGTNVAPCATSWLADDVVTGVVQVVDGVMRIARGEGM